MSETKDYVVIETVTIKGVKYISIPELIAYFASMDQGTVITGNNLVKMFAQANKTNE